MYRVGGRDDEVGMGMTSVEGGSIISSSRSSSMIGECSERAGGGGVNVDMVGFSGVLAPRKGSVYDEEAT